MKKLITGILFILSAMQSFSERIDSTAGSWGISARMDYGFVIAHRPALEPLQERHVKGFEISLFRHTSGYKEWENIFHFPDYGVTLAFFDLGSPERLGKGITLYPFVDFPLSKNPKNRFHFRYGMGLGYAEKVFNADDNFKNAAIGSHLNGVIHFDLHYEINLAERIRMEAGAGITHYSNGSFSLPNLGINVATFNVALHRSFGNKKAFQSRQLLAIDKSLQYHIHAGGFPKKVYPPEGSNYIAATLSGMLLKPLNYKSAWGAGLDILFDNSINARLERLGEKPTKSLDNFRPGIYGAYHLTVNKLGIMFNIGYYLHNSWKDDGNIYHRICLNYYFEKIFFCLNLKTHYARADMVELGIGYRIKKKPVVK